MDSKSLKKSRQSHGGNIYQEPERSFLDFSANINSHPMPQRVLDALPAILDKARAYPDIEYQALKEDLATYCNRRLGTRIQKEDLLLGNGAVELLDRAIACQESLLIPQPSFSEYELSCLRHKVPHSLWRHSQKEDGAIEILKEPVRGSDFFHQLKVRLQETGCRAVVLCNPNNPDGKRLNKEDFQDFLNFCQSPELKALSESKRSCEKEVITVIVDETFAEYLDLKDQLLPLVEEYSNLIVIRAITKFFGLPGLRLGYAMSKNQTLLQSMEAKLTTWNIGVFDQEIARLLFKEDAFIRETIKDNQHNRQRMKEKLKECQVLEEVYDSCASFLLVKSKRHDLDVLLKEKGILIRSLKNMTGLNRSYFRLAVKPPSQQDILLKELSRL